MPAVKPSWSMAALRWLVLLVLPGSYACGGACSDAIDLCEECEQVVEECQAQYENATTETCEKAVAVYEANCGEG